MESDSFGSSVAASSGLDTAGAGGAGWSSCDQAVAVSKTKLSEMER